MVHCGLEELNKALNFTVLVGGKQGQEIFNIETQLYLELDPAWASFAN